MKRLLLALVATVFASAASAQTPPPGNTFIGAGSPPTRTIGGEASWYIDATTGNIWGPKSSGSWGSSASYNLSAAIAVDSTLTNTAGTLGINLANANTWLVEQTFSGNATAPYFIATNTVESAGGGYEIRATGGPTDENNSDEINGSGTMYFRTINDAYSASNNWLILTRSGDTPTLATFGENVNVSTLAGSGSRPVCVTAGGQLEAGSLSTGLTTCP